MILHHTMEFGRYQMSVTVQERNLKVLVDNDEGVDSTCGSSEDQFHA